MTGFTVIVLHTSYFVHKEVKKAIQETAASDQALLDKSSLNLKLVEEKEEDVRISQLLKYKSIECKYARVLIQIFMLHFQTA